ncbi:hypothetical protein QR78_30130 [Methylobacterium indicum]|nr:hypothetical protein QR78_30130 [Methylobacterium indicum]
MLSGAAGFGATVWSSDWPCSTARRPLGRAFSRVDVPRLPSGMRQNNLPSARLMAISPGAVSDGIAPVRGSDLISSAAAGATRATESTRGARMRLIMAWSSRCCRGWRR